MEQHYCIVDWDQHYEVDARGKSWEPGQPFRKGRLDYVRVKARRDWNVRLLELQDLLGEEVWWAVGVFEKLCQCVGCEPRPRREGGIIRNSDGQPATDHELIQMLRVRRETWERLAGALAQVHWLAECGPVAAEAPDGPEKSGATSAVAESPESPVFPETPEIRGNPEIPEKPGIPLQVKSSQVKPKQSKSRGVIPLGLALGQLVPSGVPLRLDGDSPQLLSSTRLDFLHQIRRTLGAEEAADCRTVSNFEDWLHKNISSGRAGPELRDLALTIARDCVRGEKPVAVFLARAKQELGYIAPSRRPGLVGAREGNL